MTPFYRLRKRNIKNFLTDRENHRQHILAALAACLYVCVCLCFGKKTKLAH